MSDFDESLPSHSMFVRHVEPLAAAAAAMTASVDLQSPPPPPPPPLSMGPAPTSLAFSPPKPSTAIGSRSNSGSGKRSGASSTPKPFLRKGSRVEPSAANRSNKTPSPVTLSSSPSGGTESIYANGGSGSGSSGGSGRQQLSFGSETARVRPVPQQHSWNDDDGGELSISFQTEGSGSAKEGAGWKDRRTLDKLELDEFALLEREVEGMHSQGPSGVDPFATAKSLRYSSDSAWTPSSSVANSHSVFQPARTERSTPLVRNSLEDARLTQGPSAHVSPVTTAATAASFAQGTRHAAHSDDTFERRDSRAALRPSVASLRDVPGVTLGPDTGVANLQNDYGIYDFDEDEAADDPAPPLQATGMSAEERDETPSRRIRGVDDSHSWGAVTRPNPVEDSRDFGASGASWSASPLKQRPAPSPQVRSANASRESLSSATRPVLRPPTSSSSSSSSSSRSAERGSAGRSSAPGTRSPLERPDGLADQQVEALKRSLSDKARELEQELATYRQENSQLKQLRRQQEQALQEVSQQRSDLLKYISEEKAKTEVWCEEQRSAALKDRRTAAKFARDSRQSVTGSGGATSVRKERAEIDALQATIEKLKLDGDARQKKAKMSEQRLGQVIKDSAQAAEDLQQSLSQLEGEASTLWNYLDQAGVRVPASIIGKRMARIRKADAKPAPWRSSYVEEVEVPEVATGRTVVDYAGSAKGGSAGRRPEVGSSYGGSISGGSEAGEDSMLRESDGGPPSGPLAAAILRASPAAASSGSKAPQSPYDPLRYTQPVRDSRAKNAIGELLAAAALSPPRSSGRAAKASLDLDSSGLRPGNSLVASWARSSRSTHSSRYSNSEGDDDDDEDQDQDGEAAATFRLPQEARPSQHASPLRLSQAARPVGSPPTITINTAAPSSSSFSSSSSSAAPQVGAAGGESSTRTEEILADGRRVVRYRNGTVKEVHPDGRSVVKFVNGDTKHSAADGAVVVYYYAAAETTHTTHASGLEVYEFPNKQVEKNFPCGRKEIIFADLTRKVIHPDKTQESYFPDGVIVREYPDQTQEIITPP